MMVALRFRSLKTTALLFAALLLVPAFAPGCGQVVILPGGAISATQQFDQPNYTVQFSVASAVADPTAITSVNWVFGDTPGFIVATATTTHQYAAGGTYNVIAYIFGNNGLAGQLTTSFTVVIPDKASQPSPAIHAADVSVTVTMSWSAGNNAPQHDLFLGTDPIAVGAATTASPEYRGRLNVASYNPTDLLASTVYYWRVDEVRPTGTTTGDLWDFSTASAPAAASDFDPADLTTDVELTKSLSWTAGAGATSHDVYFGTDITAVDTATRSSGEFRGNQTATAFSPTGLTENTTYYWRIDEVGPGGTSHGIVNTFTTAAAPGKATNPSPADAATDVAVDATLSWTAGAGATSHDFYFGTVELDVDDADHSAAEFKGNQNAPTSQPAGMTADTTYFWRADEVGPGGTTKGDVYSFVTATAPEQVTDESPAIADLGVSLNPTLTWTAGTGATSHDVYFGDTSLAVNNATTGSTEFKGNQNNTDFSPTGPLDEKKQYFWRIDEKGPGGTTKGAIFSFTTLDTKAASAPDPAHESTDIPQAQTLSWTIGTGATDHDVYLGTDQTVVTNATTASPEFQGNFPAPPFTPISLDAGTTYFWRIDEHNVDGTVKGLIWKFTTLQTPPDVSSGFTPSDGATDISLSQVLSWTAGARATSHDVYFGTDQTQVTNATTATAGIFKGNRPTTTFNPGALTRATTYYWRIDEKNTAGTTAGTVVSFTTIPDPPTKATTPSPAHNSTGQNVNTVTEIALSLSWTAGTGTGTISHDVYFGTNQTNVTNATTATAGIFKGNQAGTSFNPGALLPGTDYFWRVDEKNSGGTTKGDIWKFTTFSPAPGQASGPSPAPFTTTADTMPTLSWTAGSDATSHDVYFGDNQSNVTNATRSSSEFVHNQGTTSYAPGTLTAAHTYYWRIDEVGAGGVTKGVIWNFTTP